MNLLELIGVKQFKDMRRGDVVHLVNGLTPFKLVGSGHFSNVFKKDDKIYKFWYHDRGYEKFLRFVKNNSANEHLPHVLSPIKTIPAFFKHHPSVGDRIKYVVMEPLESMPRRISLTDEGHPVQITASEFLKLVKNDATRGELKRSPDLKQDISDFIDTYERLNDFHPADDLYDQNVMWRKSDGKLVIVDPYADTDDINLVAKFKDFDDGVDNVGTTADLA